MIIVDYSGIAMGTIFSQHESKKTDLPFIRHLILNSLRMYNMKYRDKYGEMILACDGGSWRRQYFPQYKASRRQNREESSTDWKAIFEIFNAVKEEIAEYLPWRVLQVQHAEADDIIATLVESTQEFGHSEPIMIVSSDKDFIQLQKYKNVQQFSPTTKKQVTDKNPHRYLFEHIVRGDGGDGVPNIMSADDTFVENKRQTPIRSTKIESLYDSYKSGNIQTALQTDEYRNFFRNQTMIDLSMIPNDVKKSILDKIANTPKKGNSKVLNYLVTSRCNLLVECVGDFFVK